MVHRLWTTIKTCNQKPKHMTTIEQLPLTPKQQRFCDEYLTDLNATRAALRAGYSGATALSGKLMQLPKIKAYIEHHTQKAATEMEISRMEMLKELHRIAFANMGDYFDDEGRIKPMHLLTRDQKAAIWNIRVTENDKGSSVQLRLNNKLSAIEKMAKHLGFYKQGLVEAEPQIKYVYLDGNAMDEFDRFEDDSLPLPAGMSGGGSRRSDEEDDEPEVKDARWERDKAIFMEHEIERLKEELVTQKEKARKEAEAAGELEKVAGAVEAKKEEVAGAGDEKKETGGAVEPEQRVEPAPKPVYTNMGLYGKAMSEEDRKARRLERALYR
jgi:phage terminase small subunit